MRCANGMSVSFHMKNSCALVFVRTRSLGDLVLSEPGAEPGSPARQPRWGGAATWSWGDEAQSVHRAIAICCWGDRASGQRNLARDSVAAGQLILGVFELTRTESGAPVVTRSLHPSAAVPRRGSAPGSDKRSIKVGQFIALAIQDVINRT